MGTLRVGDPLDKNTDVGAINSRQQLEKIQELVEAGEEEGAEIYQPPCRLPENGYWFAPTVFTDVAQSYRIAQEEIFGPVLSVLTFRTPEEAVEKANNTPYGLSRRRLDGEGLAHPLDGRAAARRRRLGEHVQPLRSRVAVRRLQGVRLRPRGRPATGSSRTWSSSGEPARSVKKTYKLYIGGAFPRSESGRTYEAEGQNVARALAQGPPRRRARGARGAAGWAGATAYNRGQVLYRVAEMMEARRADLAALCIGRAGGRRARSIAWSGTRAGPTSSRRCSAARTRSPGRTSTSRPGADRRRRDPRPDEPALEGLVSRLAPALVGGNTVVVVASESHPLAAIEFAEVLATSDVPGGVVNILTGLQPELAPWLASHMDVNAIDVTGANGDARRARAARRRRTSSASSEAPPTAQACGTSLPSSS